MRISVATPKGASLLRRVSREQFIENNVIRNRHLLGLHDSVFIRRSRMGRGFGVADLVFLPLRGRRRLVIVEAKQGTAADATSKVIGQLMMYYAGALELGTRGLRHLRAFATQRPLAARSARPKSLRMLSAGCSPPDVAWHELCRGRRIGPNAIGLYIALDAEPSATLRAALTTLRERHGLPVGVVSVLQKDRLLVWPESWRGRSLDTKGSRSTQ